jgi:uracil-DNA glycosylase family protein
MPRTTTSSTVASTARGQVFPGAEKFIPSSRSLKVLAEAVDSCRGCDLYRRATQGVFGAGASRARVVLVGEQPGDQEDVQGKPFVGPAGKLLDRALAAAGIDRSTTYVTNVVKHIKWTPAPRGKRRVHSKPVAGQIKACMPWLEHELAIIKPDVVVCLGATAAQALLGRTFRVTQMRGKPIADTAWARAVLATVHPSSVLRAPHDRARKREFDSLVADLAAVSRLVASA